MINILIPAMGENIFFKDYYFPKMMLEIDGETILEKVIHNFECLQDIHFIFIFKEEDCMKFHLDDSAKVATNNNCTIISLKNSTRGPLCTSLMGIKEIDNQTPLIIVNSDQIIDIDYNDVIHHIGGGYDAGMITFPSIHPRWDYIRLDVMGNQTAEQVVEVTFKRPISKHAIAGVFYFSHGRDFVSAAKKSILKNCFRTDVFSISSSVNELILMGKRIGYYEVDKRYFHSFYSPEKVREYQERCRKNNEADYKG